MEIKSKFLMWPQSPAASGLPISPIWPITIHHAQSLWPLLIPWTSQAYSCPRAFERAVTIVAPPMPPPLSAHQLCHSRQALEVLISSLLVCLRHPCHFPLLYFPWAFITIWNYCMSSLHFFSGLCLIRMQAPMGPEFSLVIQFPVVRVEK